MDITQLLLNKPVVPADGACPRTAAIRHDGQEEARRADQLRSAARQFETILLHQIVKQMNETTDYMSLDEEDESGQQILGMYGSFLAEAMGQQGGLGFWKTMYEDLARMQGDRKSVV